MWKLNLSGQHRDDLLECIVKTCIYYASVDDLRVSERNYPICEDCNLLGNALVLRHTKVHL